MTQNDTTTWSITYDHHSYNYRGVIYAPRVVNYAPRKLFIVQASLMMIVIYNRHVLIVQATGQIS
jgi:hypothetical protein